MSAKCAVLVDGALFGVRRCKTDKNNTPEQTAKDLALLAEEAIKLSGIAKEQIGRGISTQGEVITKPIQRKVNRFMLGGKNSPAVKVVAATLGNDAGIFGAAAFAENKNKTE